MKRSPLRRVSEKRSEERTAYNSTLRPSKPGKVPGTFRRPGSVLQRSTIPARGKALKRSLRRLKGKYEHAEWVKLRRQVRKRSGGWCEVCPKGESRATEVHHKSYGRGNNWRSLIVPLDQLVHVCRACHELQHPHLRADRGLLPLPATEPFVEAA